MHHGNTELLVEAKMGKTAKRTSFKTIITVWAAAKIVYFRRAQSRGRRMKTPVFIGISAFFGKWIPFMTAYCNHDILKNAAMHAGHSADRLWEAEHPPASGSASAIAINRRRSGPYGQNPDTGTCRCTQMSGCRPSAPPGHRDCHTGCSPYR